MRIDSLAISFRIGLAFHALNNEGGGGTNVMEPRRITVGETELDGISGEMVRRHILEQFVRLAEREGVPLSRAGRGLLPDRGKEDLVAWMRHQKIKTLAPEHYAAATDHLLRTCALRDVGGYLMALESTDGAKGTLKRDSVFEVGWLISGHAGAVDMTQHAAYHPDPEQHHLFVQNQRSGVYGCVMRIDLGRIGRNDWAWLDENFDIYAVPEPERGRRADLLLRAIEQFMLSPAGAKQAGWLQHTGSLEGIIVVSREGPAPFRSPVLVSVDDRAAGAVSDGDVLPGLTVAFDRAYRERMEAIVEAAPDRYQAFRFDDQASLVEATARVREVLSA